MAIQRIHPGETLFACLAQMGALFGVQRLVAFAIMLASKAFFAFWPFTDVWLFLGVRPQVTSQIEPPRERAPTSRHGTFEQCVVPPSLRAGGLCRSCGDSRLFNLEDRRQARDLRKGFVAIRRGWRLWGWGQGERLSASRIRRSHGGERQRQRRGRPRHRHMMLMLLLVGQWEWSAICEEGGSESRQGLCSVQMGKG